MSPEERDAALLHDMLRFSEEAAAMVKGLSFQQYSASRVHMLALERVLQVIGEAASHVSDEQRVAAATIPWEQIIGQRNVLAHMYGEIRHDRLFRTAREDVPRLIVELRALLQ